MQSYINPKVVVIPSPVGLDAQIAKLQEKVASLPWMQTVFGRAIAQREVDNTGRSLVFPEVWGRNREPENVMHNDNLKAYAFFVARDPGTFNEYDPGDVQVLMQQPVSCIVWANTRRIDATKKYRFSEILKAQLLRVLGSVRSLQFSAIYEQWDRVFEPFTITETYRQYLKPPYYAVRVDFLLSYPVFEENCSDAFPAGILLSEEGGNLLEEEFATNLEAE